MTNDKKKLGSSLYRVGSGCQSLCVNVSETPFPCQINVGRLGVLT